MASGWTIALLVGAYLASAPALAQTQPPRKIGSVIPAQYRGEWTNRPNQCGKDSWNEDSVLHVATRSVGYYDNTYMVLRVSVVRNALRIVVKPRNNADIAPVTYLKLAPDGHTIFVAHDDKVGLKRCPETEPKG